MKRMVEFEQDEPIFVFKLLSVVFEYTVKNEVQALPSPLLQKYFSLSSFLPRLIILWNSLPSELQKSSSLSTFKSALKSHLCT